MPLNKDNSIITNEFSVYPYESYVRIAKVEQVSLFSKDMIVQFLDGAQDEFGNYLEGPVIAQCIVGSDDPSTTYAPSATVYGRGDLANILVLESGDLYAISLCDLWHDINRENFATIKGWALYDILNGMLVDYADDDENSYLTFWRIDIQEGFGYSLENEVITKISGDPNKRHIMRRMLDRFTKTQTQSGSRSYTTDPAWYYDKEYAAPDNNPMRKIHNRMHKGYYVNGFPYICDTHFTNDNATLENNIIAYHSTLEDLFLGDPHPLLNGTVINRTWENSTVIWWDEEEPTHVVLIGSFPQWDTCKTILFLELPVYCMTGRKFLEREVIDEGLPTEEFTGNILQTWQKYSEHVRVLGSIDRTQYVDFLLVDDLITNSEYIMKGVVAFCPTQLENDIKDFCILDGHPYIKTGTLCTTNACKRIAGTIERTLKPTEADGSRIPYTNGSLYDYTVTHNNPVSSGTLDLDVPIRWEYEWNNGDMWERQTITQPSKEYLCYDDTSINMHNEIELEYFCDGYYPVEYIVGRIGWSDGGGLGYGNNQLIDNWNRKKVYRNGLLRWENYWEFKKTSGFGMQGKDSLYTCFYADVEYDLYVLWKTETNIEPHLGIGPGWTFTEPLGTHTQRQSGIVLFQGIEWYMWTYLINMTEFPTIYNYFPWHYQGSEVGIPIWPGGTSPSGPYSIDQMTNEPYFLQSQYSPYIGTLKTGYTIGGMGYPGPIYGPNTIQYIQDYPTSDPSAPGQLLQVSIDKETDSFCVIWEPPYQTDTLNHKYLSIPNGKKLFRFNGGMPHFNEPSVTNNIVL